MRKDEPIKSLESIDLSGCTILDKNFSGVTFNGAKFCGTRFNNVDFSGAKFVNCDFTESRLTDCILDYSQAILTDFSLTIFEASSVSEMQMRECKMEAVSPYSTDLSQIDMNDTPKLRELTQEDLDVMYAKHILFNHGENGEKADFSNCHLKNLDIRHMQLNGAIFDGAILENVKMASAGICFCSFKNARLVGCGMEGIYAEEADFSGAHFVDCKMQRGIYTHSNFANTKFRGTNLTMADLPCCCIEGSDILQSETVDLNLAGASLNEQEWSMGGLT